MKNIRKNIIWIAIIGAIYGLACNMHLLMEGPQSLVALKDGNVSSAVSISFARALSFIPLKALTSLTTGTFVTDGFGFTATAGFLAPNGVLAAVFGAVVLSLEALSLAVIAVGILVNVLAVTAMGDEGEVVIKDDAARRPDPGTQGAYL